MPNYTIREVIGQPNAWNSTKGGPMLSYSLDVTGDDGFTGQVELNQKQTTAAPTVGQVIDGTLDRSNPKYAPKLKKTPPQGGGGPRSGAGRPRDPAERESIERSVAYKGAVDLVAAMLSHPEPSQEFSVPLTVESFFHHGLSLLQGSATSASSSGHTEFAPLDSRADVKAIIEDAFPGSEEVAPTSQELTDGYKEFMARQPGRVEGERLLETKKTALGIAGPAKDATPTQKRELLEWFKEN